MKKWWFKTDDIEDDKRKNKTKLFLMVDEKPFLLLI